MCCCIPNFIKIRWFFVELSPFSIIFKITEFSKFKFVTWRLLPCYFALLCNISLNSDNWLMCYSQKWFLEWRPFTILNSKNCHIWSCDCHRVPDLLLWTIFHQNRTIFRWDMANSRFSRWRMSTIMNFRSLIIGSLDSPCMTSYRSSIEYKLFCFSEDAFFVRILATGRCKAAIASGGLISVPYIDLYYMYIL